MACMPADDPLLISDMLASPLGENGQHVDYEGAGSSASDLEYALAELDKHAPFYREAQLYAQGRSPELFFLSDTARRDAIAMIDGFRFNFAGLVVATIADRILLNGIDGIEGTGVDKIVFDANELYSWFPESIYDMLTDGDHYILTLPGDDAQEGDAGTPVLIPCSALDTRLFYDSEVERIPEMGIRRWAVGRGRETAVRANLWYPDRVERFIRPPDGNWQRHSADGLPDIEDSPFIPFAHMRTRMPYGRPIHADAYGPQDAIVKAIITLMASTEFAGWAQRYALHEESMIGQSGLPQAGSGRRVDGTDVSRRSAALRAGPGTVWDVYAKAVGHFPAADLSKLIETVEMAVKGMSQVTRIPMHYFDPLGAGSSGEARIAADQPVKASAARQRGNAGAAVRKSTTQVGDYIGVRVDPEAVWAPDPVVSEKTWWETAAIKTANGVPKRQILIEAGYTPEQIDEFEAENERNAPDIPAPGPTVPPADPNNPQEEND